MKECEAPRNLSCPDRSGKMCKDCEWLIKFYDARLQDMEKAVAIASQLLQNRMDGFPEQYVRRGETAPELSRLRSDIDSLLGFMNRSEGMASSKSVDTVRWIAVAGLFVSIIGLSLRLLNIGN